MRELIAQMPPLELLGYIYGQRTLHEITSQGQFEALEDCDESHDIINENQFLLEYVHAVWASDITLADPVFDEEKCTELYELSRTLRNQAMVCAMATSTNDAGGAFGSETGEIEFHAKSSWIMMRGNRYQVLEEEFYSYVLAPHNDVLIEAYGVGSAEVAKGFQAIANASRSGVADAIDEIEAQQSHMAAYAAKSNTPPEDAMIVWAKNNPERSGATHAAMQDLLFGGTTNLSRHTALPPLLLADLAYERGEEREFFAPGDLAGTPFRTLPARKKPLIRLKQDYYAVDPCFTRDAGYRAILYNLLRRKPSYKGTFLSRQKSMSESAFADILADQFPDATIFQEVYYKDPTTNDWVESDTLILFHDALYLVEAKAGAAATIASPAVDFDRHAQSIKDLILKAYEQCERFFNYLKSANEVPIYRLLGGKYEECHRLRRSDYRVMLPIGLTVESFSPFSSYCKELPQIKPLLEKHAFISISIDDLFVLKRFLRAPGLFTHYMEVRQAVAGIRRAHLYDEIDHLGAYISMNRFDHIMADQLNDYEANILVWDRMSDNINKCFKGENWEAGPFLEQYFPSEVQRLLELLNTSRVNGWLSVDSCIRNFGEEGREQLARQILELRATLKEHPFRYFAFADSNSPFFIWLQEFHAEIDWVIVKDKAIAAALAAKSVNQINLLVKVSADGVYYEAHPFTIHVPTYRNAYNRHLYHDAKLMAERAAKLAQQPKAIPCANAKKPGRNDKCPCGSGKKYKKCCGG